MSDGNFADVSARLQQSLNVWVDASRSGDTAVGMAIENHLGVPENNRCEPDILDTEVKVKREETSAHTTLLTMNPTQALGQSRLTVHRMMDTYGVVDVNSSQIRFNTNLAVGRLTRFRDILTVGVTDQAVQIIRHPDGEVICEWDMAALERRLNKKLPNLALGTARIRHAGPIEQCNVSRWDCFSGFRMWRFKEMVESGDISVHFRVKADWVNGTARKRRNRGTAFRISPNRLRDLYNDFETLLPVQSSGIGCATVDDHHALGFSPHGQIAIA